MTGNGPPRGSARGCEINSLPSAIASANQNCTYKMYRF